MSRRFFVGAGMTPNIAWAFPTKAGISSRAAVGLSAEDKRPLWHAS